MLHMQNAVLKYEVDGTESRGALAVGDLVAAFGSSCLKQGGYVTAYGSSCLKQGGYVSAYGSSCMGGTSAPTALMVLGD